LLPQAEIDYAYVAPSYKDLLYMFPRKHEIILGGTSEPNNWSLKPSDKETDRILPIRSVVDANNRDKKQTT